MVTESKMSSGTKGEQSGEAMPKLDPLDKELGKETVKDVLGDYIDEADAASRTHRG